DVLVPCLAQGFLICRALRGQLPLRSGSIFLRNSTGTQIGIDFSNISLRAAPQQLLLLDREFLVLLGLLGGHLPAGGEIGGVLPRVERLLGIHLAKLGIGTRDLRQLLRVRTLGPYLTQVPGQLLPALSCGLVSALG